MKGDIAQIRRGALAADQPLLIGEFVVQHLQHPTHVRDIVGMSLRVGFEERPVKDALEDWALRRGLELQPLLREVVLRQGGEADELLRVVLIEDVVHDGAGLWVISAGCLRGDRVKVGDCC